MFLLGCDIVSVALFDVLILLGTLIWAALQLRIMLEWSLSMFPTDLGNCTHSPLTVPPFARHSGGTSSRSSNPNSDILRWCVSVFQMDRNIPWEILPMLDLDGNAISRSLFDVPNWLKHFPKGACWCSALAGRLFRAARGKCPGSTSTFCLLGRSMFQVKLNIIPRVLQDDLVAVRHSPW